MFLCYCLAIFLFLPGYDYLLCSMDIQTLERSASLNAENEYMEVENNIDINIQETSSKSHSTNPINTN